MCCHCDVALWYKYIGTLLHADVVWSKKSCRMAGIELASFIDLHKKKGARNRQRQHRTKTGKSEGFNDSPENQVWLISMRPKTDDLLVLHGLLGSDRKIAAERTHQNLS